MRARRKFPLRREDGDNVMHKSLIVQGRLRASQCLNAMALLSLTSALTSAGQNAAVRFIDSQPVPVSNFCYNEYNNYGASGTYQALPGHFHTGTLTDLMVVCAPTYPAGTPASFTASLNEGNGTFKAIQDSAVQYLATSAQVADLNGDHFDDLILTGEDNYNSFEVQISNGDGTFKAPVTYTPSPSNSSGIVLETVTGDFNGDGKLDIAIVNSVTTTNSNNTSSTADTLIIFLNTGSGGMAQGASYPISTTPTGAGIPLLIAGDLNGDSETDLAVVSPGANPTVTPYFATGGGAFRKGGSFSAGTTQAATNAVIGRFTSSGYGDIAITTPTGIVTLLGNSAGTFSKGPSTSYPYPLSANSSGLFEAAADFDKDGNLDLAVSAGGFVMVFWGAGNGGFTGPTALSQSLFPRSMAVADMQGDGRPDLIVTGIDGSVSLLFNRGDRLFSAAANTYSPNASGIVTRDFNRDGKQDIAVVNTPSCKAPCDGTVSVFTGSGADYFNAGKSYSIGMHGSAIAVGDVNGDGIDDLVVTNATAGDNADTSVLLGIKGGTFQAARNYTLGSLSNVAYLVDMNNDGKLDLVEDGGVALGKGDGTFGPLKPFPNGIGFATNANGQFTTYLGVGDFNGDGIHDIAALYQDSSQQDWLAILQGDGKGDFSVTQSYGIGDQNQGVVVGKLHGGNIDDIVVVSSAAADSEVYGEAIIFLGNGKGSFQQGPLMISLTDGTGYGTVTIADFNHDGFNDIGVASGDEFVVLPGNGTGTFPSSELQAFYLTAGSATNPSGNIAVADFNGDGWPDVVSTNSYGITRLYGIPVPVVSPSSLTWTSNTAMSVSIRNNLTTAQNISGALDSTAPPQWRISANTCKGALAPGATCTVTVEYVSSGKPATNKLYIGANGLFIAYVALNGN